jgi:hypothetical protein
MIAPIKMLLAALLLLAPTIAVEAGTRTLVDSGRLPFAPSSSEYADVGLANLARLGKPDVLVLGTSAIRNALQPDVLEELIAAETGEEVHVQGLAQSAMSLKAQRLLVEGLAQLELLPDTVITGLTPVSLGGDNRDGDWFIHSELGQAWRGCADISDPVKSIDCWLGQASAMWRWRGRPDQLLSAVGSGVPRTLREGGRTLHENGWTSEKPATERQLRKVLPATLERLQEEIFVPAFVFNEFIGLVSDLRSRGVEVIVVEMPYSPLLVEALLQRNPAWEEQRRAGFELLGQAADIDIVEIEALGDWATASAFHDLRHLSRKGAEPFTRQLWDMPEFREPVLNGVSSAGATAGLDSGDGSDSAD